MLAEPTLQRLYSMRLHGMAEAYCRQLEDPSAGELPFEDRFGLLVESQWTWKESRALTRRLQLAKLKQQACLEDINYRHPRGLQATRFKGMAHESAWVRRRQNVLLVGPTGVGKTRKTLSCRTWRACCVGGLEQHQERQAALSTDEPATPPPMQRTPQICAAQHKTARWAAATRRDKRARRCQRVSGPHRLSLAPQQTQPALL